MTGEKLSKKQFKCLKTICYQTVAFITDDISKECDYLCELGLIEIIELATVKEFDEETANLNLNSAKLIAEINEAGKAYVDTHTSWIKRVRWDFIASLIAILLSFVSIILEFK